MGGGGGVKIEKGEGVVGWGGALMPIHYLLMPIHYLLFTNA